MKHQPIVFFILLACQGEQNECPLGEELREGVCQNIKSKNSNSDLPYQPGPGDICPWPEPSVFYSSRQMPCGDVMDNDDFCNWKIRFAEGLFQWHYGDKMVSGDHSCDGVFITGLLNEDSVEYFGKYDPIEEILIWDNIEYDLTD